MEANRASRGPSRGGHRGPGRRGARGATASTSALGSDTSAFPGNGKWKVSESGEPYPSDRPASGRGERSNRGSARTADDPTVKQSSREDDASVTPPRASWYQRGSRARGRYPRSAWGGPVGRSDDQHWRQHDDRRSAEAPVGANLAVFEAAQDPRLSGIDRLSVAAPEFVPNEGFSLFGPYSFIALGPTGQPVTMMLQPAPGQLGLDAKQEGLTTDQKAVIAAMAVVAPPIPVSVPIANVLPNQLPPTVKTEEPLKKLEEAQPPLWKDRRPVTGFKQPGTAGVKTDQEPDNRKGKTETVETKIISPRELNPGCSRLTHRGSINFQGEQEVVRGGSSKHACGNDATNSNDAPKAPVTNQTSRPRGTVQNCPPPMSATKKNEKPPSKINFSSSGSPLSANAVAATKRILSRADKRNPVFASNDFPALDSKLKELKLEAEARESAPITWRRSEPDHGDSNKSDRTDGGKPKFSYAARLRNVRVAEPQISAPPAREKGAETVGDKTTAKGSNDDWWEPDKKPAKEDKRPAEDKTLRNPVIESSSIDVIDEGPSAEEADPSATAKPKRRRRRRRKKVADPSSRDDGDDDGDAPVNGEIRPRGEGPSALSGSEIADRDGAAKIEDGETTTTTTAITSHKAEVNRVSTDQEEDIFKDDDFPDFLVDFRRGLASAAAAATRKIPRVIGSKVTKLGAGKPLSKAVNEWTDITSDDVKDERKNQVEASLPTTSAWPSAWGNATARSFAETLKMAARPTAAPVPTKTDVAKPTEDVETAKKRKRKKKKKAKSEETAEVPQQTKKSKAPLMLDLSALVPKKSDDQSQPKKKPPAKNDVIEPTQNAIRLRGKEREKPKAKRPSKMKRVIATERQLLRQRRELLLKLQAALHAPHARFIGGGDGGGGGSKSGNIDATAKRDNSTTAFGARKSPTALPGKDDWLTTDAESDDDDADENAPIDEAGPEAVDSKSAVATADEPLPKVARLIGDESAEFDSLDRDQLEAKVAENLMEIQGEDKRIKHWGPKALHTRKFREYCTHFVDNEINATVKTLMLELMRLQDKIYQREKEAAVNMFKTKRRFFNGLREVLKYIKLKKIKLLIVASDVESIKSSGGLDDVMDQILQLAKEQDVFTAFTMSRFPLGKVMKKPVPVSCVGVKDFGGCESIVKELKKKVQEKTREYDEKVREIMALESEQETPSVHVR